MARTRPGLETAINEILARRGSAGKRMSYRQAERLTGLSPATIGELAKGNARTPETIRRFAQGMQEDVSRLLLLAGFVPEERDTTASNGFVGKAETRDEVLDEDESEWLGRFGKALAQMPPGRERALWKDGLRRDTELLESFLERMAREDSRNTVEKDKTDDAP